MSKGRVLVAMSGGVDSSVAAQLLQEQGYECIGATMRLATNEDDHPGEKTCCSVDDIADAKEACWALGIRHHVFDYTAQFERDVIQPFIKAYQEGRTPNPCVGCNRYLKFGALMDRAHELGCSYLATGHYAQVKQEADGLYHLYQGVDPAKDQSYFLFGLTQERLAHVIFPLGGYVKATQVRELAQEAGLVVASKKDSEGICFVPEGDHAAYIEERTGEPLPVGDVIDVNGKVLGQHRGTARYTLGQRKGLGIAADRPLFVCNIDAKANTITLGDTPDLMKTELVACECNWISGSAPEAPFEASAKVRYHQPNQACTVTPLEGNRFKVSFVDAQRAPVPGQAVVIYRDSEVLGGGIIESCA